MEFQYYTPEEYQKSMPPQKRIMNKKRDAMKVGIDKGKRTPAKICIFNVVMLIFTFKYRKKGIETEKYLNLLAASKMNNSICQIFA